MERSDSQMHLFAKVTANSDDSVILFGIDGSIQAWNGGAQRIYGWTEEEALRMNIRDIVPADRRDEISGLIRRVTARETVVSFDTKRCTREGRVLDIWLTVTPVWNDEGKLEAIATTGRDITDRKLTEEAIIKAKKEWERTFDGVPDLIAIIDDRHRVVRVNRTMSKRLGLPPEQCVGLPCYKVVHGTDRPHCCCPHSQTLLDSREHVIEIHEDRFGGDFLVSTTPIFSPEGRVTGSIHVARDITEQKRIEKEHETAAEFLRIANESRGTSGLLRAVVSFFNERSGCEAVGIRLRKGDDFPYFESCGFSGHPILERMCGDVISGRVNTSGPFVTSRGNFWTNSTTGFLAASSEAELQPPTDNPPNCELHESVALIALRNGEDCLGLLQFCDRRKNRFTPETIALLERISDYLSIALAKAMAEGELETLTAELERRVADQTTEIRDAHEVVKGERQRLYDVLETLPVYVILLSQDYRVPFANRFFRERFGESHGRRCYDYLFNRTEPCENCETYKVLKTKAPHLWEWTGPDDRNYDIYDFPFTDSDGDTMIMEMGIDVTHVKKAQAAINELNETLERRVADRTYELKQAMERITAINRELNDFAHAVSHDLKSPLRAVSMLVDIIGTDYAEKLGDEGRDNFNLLKRRVVQMYNLIEGVLVYSRLGRVEEKETLTDIRDVVDRAIDLVNPPAHVTVTVKDELPTIFCDPVRIQQVFQNLIGNSAKHMDKPEGEVTIGCSPDNGNWRFYVRDNGPGIDKKHHERIFKIFQTLKSKDEAGGSGIGLSIVRRVIEGHGGKVWVESNVGEGSTFFFTIPQDKTTRQVKQEHTSDDPA